MAEHVDIYEDLNTEEAEDSVQSEADALYDDVLTGSVTSVMTPVKTESEDPKSEDEKLEGGKPLARPFSVYVGHFNWWTSDKDLIAMAKKLGVKDVVEVKFAENKANGQSRGFAEMVVSTEESVKRLLETMSLYEINGEKLECRVASRKYLKMFESEARKRIPLRLSSKSSPEQDGASTSSPPPSSPNVQRFPPPPLFHPPSKPPSFSPPFFNSASPLFNTPPPRFPPCLPYAPFPNALLPTPPLPGMFPPDAFFRNTPPPNTHVPNPFTHPRTPAPSLHINPSFVSGHNTHNTHNSGSSNSNTPYSQNRDGESEELINRNRTVASSAIKKAMSEATSGEISLAVETLLTAMAVIRQSRVYTDERCHALIESLKDCLYSVESKNCSSRKRHRSQERPRSRERDRYRDRSSSSDRERERDRNRGHSSGSERARGQERDHRHRH
ncbi:cleavage and polyadenylation specificity factor subunit 7-like isoform X2 [Trichomycterus rosablanca]|uniref:cleavage and polyadenylation specificity factor subunit 7-like isoform X2 n=1 Tax=Trichomycterus rosablanca TaxID=2290929 RepID=UPI002F35AA94